MIDRFNYKLVLDARQAIDQERKVLQFSLMEKSFVSPPLPMMACFLFFADNSFKIVALIMDVIVIWSSSSFLLKVVILVLPSY